MEESIQSGDETLVNEEIDSLWKIYNTVNEWIRFSDTKATALLAINGVITGFYFSNITELKSILAEKPIMVFLLLTSIGFILVSTLCSMFCIVPRLKINKNNSLIFFSDIAKKYSTVEDYEKAIEKALTDKSLKKEIISQIWANSKVANKKYDWVTCSVYFFVVTILASLAFVVLASI